MEIETIVIHYSVQNGGDGSASPTFMETSRLAEWDQEMMSGEWCEPCTGTLKIEVIKDGYVGSPSVVTELGYLIDHWLEHYRYGGWDLLDRFKKCFFPGGVPRLHVRLDETNEAYYLVCHRGSVVSKSFAHHRDKSTTHGRCVATEAGCVALEEDLKSLYNKDE